MTEEILKRARALEMKEMLTGELFRQIENQYKLAFEEEREEALGDAIDGLWYSRKNRHEHPDGYFDNAGRWYPSDEEECKCCSHIRTPSRSWKYNLIKHARTRPHIRSLAAESPDHFHALTGYSRLEYVPLEVAVLVFAPLLPV